MSTAFRLTEPLAALERAQPVEAVVADVGHVERRGPWQRHLHAACHCHDDGSSALYWKIAQRRDAGVLSPVPSVCSWPLRRSCDVEIGGLPGIENTVFPSGRS